MVWTPPRPEVLDGTEIWETAEIHAEKLELRTNRPVHPTRDLWYVPTVSIYSAHRARVLFEKYGIERVYDLGAGDFRFSLWCDKQGYDVVAYELNSELVEAVRDRFSLEGIEIRERDYHADFGGLVGDDVALVAFGGTNTLTQTPTQGVGIVGYTEIGISATYDGVRVAEW